MNYLFKCLFAIMLVFISFGSKTTACENSPQYFSKVYFTLDQVRIQNNELFLFVEDSLISIQTILNDQQGFHTFISAIETGGRPPMGTWMCPRCQKANSSFDTKCFHCRWPDPQ